MTGFYLYLLLVLGALKDFMVLFSILVGVGAFCWLIITALIWDVHYDGGAKKEHPYCYPQYFKAALISAVLAGFLSCFIPTTKQMAFIYVGSKLINNEKISNIGDNALDLTSKLMKYATQYVDEQLEEKKAN